MKKYFPHIIIFILIGLTVLAVYETFVPLDTVRSHTPQGETPEASSGIIQAGDTAGVQQPVANEAVDTVDTITTDSLPTEETVPVAKKVTE